jgi:hypothetical protein
MSSLCRRDGDGRSSTFSQVRPLGRLAVREDGLNKDAHAAAGRVYPAHHAEAQAFLPRPLLELHVVNAAKARGRLQF